MQAYIYQGALLCTRCACLTIADLMELNRQDTGDSGSFPQGPYERSGGSADSPRHCDSCGLFLENPLTHDGRDYTRELIANSNPLHPSPAVLEYAEFYKHELCYCLDIEKDIESGDCDMCKVCHYSK